MVKINDFLMYLPFFTLGVGLELVAYKIYRKRTLNKKKKSFSLAKFAFLIFSPAFGTVIYIFKFGSVIVYVYLLSAFLGTFFEWLMGFSYHKLMGERLWTYHQKPIHGYTSAYSIPLWGFLGVVFWLLVRIFT